MPLISLLPGYAAAKRSVGEMQYAAIWFITLPHNPWLEPSIWCRIEIGINPADLALIVYLNALDDVELEIFVGRNAGGLGGNEGTVALAGGRVEVR